MENPKTINFDAFRVLLSRFFGCMHHKGLDEPKSVEEWMADLLYWLHYPEIVLRLARKSDVTSWLEVPFAELFEEDFDYEKYHGRLPEKIAEMTDQEAPEVKRGQLKLVE
jgi:hypothetical protein